MTPDPARVQELFFGALDLPEDAVAAYLDAACAGDRALRDEVASLLSFHDERALVEPAGLAPIPPDPPPPTPSPDRYRELGALGEGGCGRVTRVWDDVLQRAVALKQVVVSDPVRAAMLRREARLLAWLDHPGAVPVYGGSLDGDDAHYTMRVLDGQTLRERIDAGPMALPEALRVLSRVGETLANAHAKGVVHLDLKPANIMLLPYGATCVLDWGTARFHDPSAYAACLEAAGAAVSLDPLLDERVMGTPAYMSVEQAAGEAVGPAADLYACGVMLYEMLAGRLPFAGDDPVAVMMRKAAGDFPPLRTLRPDVPPALDALCRSLLSPRAEDRPASVEVVLDRIAGLWLGGGSEQRRRLPAGTQLFAQGEAGDAAYQVVSGALSIRWDGGDGPVELARRGPGELVGEMAVVSGEPRSAAAVAVVDTVVTRVTAEVIEQAMERAAPLLSHMLQSLIQRLREASRGAEGRPS